MPTEDEWYKAAYFKPDASGYSIYANGTDTIPTFGTASGWNYYNNGYVIGYPNLVWEAGFGGQEQNGTYDMMGNLQEWVENISGVLRGGCMVTFEDSLRSSYRYTGWPNSDPSTEGYGFRVVAIPEPASVMMIALGGLLIAGYRRFYGLM